MPHDKNGVLLQPGDLVSLPCLVRDVSPGEEFCNVTLVSQEPMFPGDQLTTIVVNTKQVKFLDRSVPT